MLTARYFSATGEAGDSLNLPEELFDGVVHDAALHQTIKAYLANQRQGNASTKTRAEVAGGGRKAWRQKGTGRARQGSIRAPHWRGGGVVFGPSPRSYNQRVPKKVKALARRSAFNTRALAEQVSVIERFDLDAPKTRRFVELLSRIGIGDRKVLILTDEVNSVVSKSTHNLQNVRVMRLRDASPYEVLRANELLIEESALSSVSTAGSENDA